MLRPRLLLAAVLLAPAAPARAAGPPAARPDEASQMLLAILLDLPQGIGTGWFRPSETAYGWKWLASRFDADRDGAVTREEFRGPPFDRLDRDYDGRLTRADF